MAVLGLVVGYGVATMMAADKAEDLAEGGAAVAMKTTDTKAADPPGAHQQSRAPACDLASAAVRSGFDGKADFTAVAGSLDENSVALSEAVGSVYGKEAGDKFLEIWRSHIGFFVDYTSPPKAVIRLAWTRPSRISAGIRMRLPTSSQAQIKLAA